MKNQNHEDLARAVSSELMSRTLTPPPLEVLAELFGMMYHVSLRTEEGESTSFHVVYMDPQNPDPNPPERIVHHRWTFIRFDRAIDFTVTNLLKVARASDPRTSSFAVYSDVDGHLFLWGLVDQGNNYFDFVNHESDSVSKRPGIFQASIAGIGHLVAYAGLKKIAELKIDDLVTNVVDVFSGGPLHDALSSGLSQYLSTIKLKVSDKIYQSRDHWDLSLKVAWIQALCRLLLRTQRYRHGGAILISPNHSAGLNIKYAIQYPRLKSALETQALLRINNTYTSDVIWEQYLEDDSETIPADLHLDQVITQADLDENRRELDGAIWFISLLTRVDGLVLLNPCLEVEGFGVEITYSEPPSASFLAVNRSATRATLKELDYNHFGTRHRSMMRYIAKVPGSVGFVVSQDGDVRAMTQVRKTVVVWENIQLQSVDFIHRRKNSLQV